MADEWDEEGITVGKSFGSNNYATSNGDEDGEWASRDTGNETQRDGGERGGRGGFRKFGGENGAGEEEGHSRFGGRGFGRGGRENGGSGRGGGGAGRGRRNFDDNDQEGGFNNNKGEDEDGEKPKKMEFYIPPEPTEDEDELFGRGISSGINFAKYDKIPVKVTGENIPPAITSFENAGLRPLIMTNIKKSGYTIPTPIQKVALPVIMAQRDLMACAQTGSGKTAAFLVPIIHKLIEGNYDLTIGCPQALVVSPTRELTIQIFNEARKFARDSCLKISIVYGGTSSKYQGDNVAKGCHILIATPGRLLDFVDRGFITFEDTRFVVLDEADRMLDMGFMPSVERIMKHETMRDSSDRQNLMFSATFPEEIQRLAGQFLNDYIFITIGIVGGACSDVEQIFHEVSKFKKRTQLLEVLEENGAIGTMVFVETKRNADFLASFLSETKFPTTSIHGDRLQREREMALSDFRSGRMQVLIATAVAARGLDIKNVAHVINYDLPKSIDEYVHRIGRTGRVGNRGKATSFFDPEQDMPLVPDLRRILKQADQPIPEFLIGGDGGGGDGYRGNNFGGRDVRSKQDSAPAPQEEVEEWN